MSISIRDGRGALRLVLCALFCLLPAACGSRSPWMTWWPAAP